MQPQRQVKYSSIISQQSRKSNPSSCRSLERPSWSEREHSLNKNRSLIDVMSLQSSKRSGDLYQKILAQDVIRSSIDKSKTFGSGFNPLKTCFKMQVQPNPRFSYEEPVEMNHICLCYMICKKEECPCHDHPDEQCRKDFCCKECIEAKRRRKTQKSAIQMESQPRLWCTCKKTKCNKKYCTCFAAGVKCGRHCSCEDCVNCDVQEGMDVEPVCYVDEEIAKLDMPEGMDFEPFAYRYSYNS